MELETETGRERKKRVPVYILEFMSGVTAVSPAVQIELQDMDDFIVTESEDRGGSGDASETGEKRKRRRRYAYTLIFKQPEGSKARIVMTTEEGKKANNEVVRPGDRKGRHWACKFQ